MSYGAPAEVVGRRIVAGLIDFVVVIVLMVVVGVVFGQGYSGHGHAGVSLHGVSVAVWAILSLGYYFVTEQVFGQTLGKKVLRLRVASRTGDRPSPGAIGIRTLLRIIDFLPFLYLLGLISVLATGRRGQRLGDLAAGTTVAAAPVLHEQPAG